MNLKYINFVEMVERLCPGTDGRGPLVAAAVATCVSRHLPIPTTAVQDPVSTFIDQVGTDVRTAISAVNEGVVFDTRYALELTRQLWLVRYYSAHPRLLPMSVEGNPLDFFCSMAEIDRIVAPNDYQFLTENKVTIARLAIELNRITQERGIV